MLGQTHNLFADDTPPVTAGYVTVALERSIDAAGGGFSYAVPLALAGLAVGQRVTVPLGRGNKPTSGWVVETTDKPDPAVKRFKHVLAVADDGPPLPDALVTLARWIAAYYCCPLGMVFGTMMPAAVKRSTGRKMKRRVRAVMQNDGDTEAETETKGKLKGLQAAVYEAACAAVKKEPKAGWMDPSDLADQAGAKTNASVMQLVKKGLLEEKKVAVVESDLDLRAQRAAGEVDAPPTLMQSQAAAVNAVGQALGKGFSVHLLHGITGSGKTEVYLRAIAKLFEDEKRGNATCLESEGSPPFLPGVIVLVPEIALTPQTVGRFIARFGQAGGGVAVLHSGLTAAQRNAQWGRLRRGEARIAVGARSAVFAPLPKVGLIIVDEEHEGSYKQDQLPRYHARDVAIRRAQLEGCPVVLGSATPSLESYSHAKAGRFALHSLPDRVPGAQLPQVEIVDLQRERQERKGIHLLSRRLESLMQSNAAAGGQTVLLLNRRGYANYIACPDHRCGWMMRCHHCDVTMVYHREKKLPSGGVVRCHHCQAEQMLERVCPESGHSTTVFGLGTQRVEEEISRKFPQLKMARMDADTMRNADDYRRVLEGFTSGETDLLLGTQMIAKGLDVENVRLVGVVSADTALNLPDFRASERTFQLIAQVAGRAGRGKYRGRVVVQTFSPEDPAIVQAAAHDFESFAAGELESREGVGLPPSGRMARIVLRDLDLPKLQKRSQKLAHALREAVTRLNVTVRVRGPVACSIARIADHHRHQVELMADSAAPIQQVLTDLRNAGKLISDTHTAVDVDPVSLL
ncbi:MAG: primosomal protein N' [Algisphaera sp.]